MQRRHLVLIGVLVLVLVIALFVLVARPVLVLPAVTVSLPGNNTLGMFQRQLKANELTFRVRTDGKVMISADGQALARVTYDPASFSTAADLAIKTGMPTTVRTGLTVAQYLFPQLLWNVYVTGLAVYYAVPVEITIRCIPG